MAVRVDEPEQTHPEQSTTDADGSSAAPTTLQQRAAAARPGFKPVAAQLARAVVDDPQPFTPSRPLTQKAEWFTGAAGAQLVVVADHHEGPKALDEILAYALAWQEDKDLLLILPEEHRQPTLNRLAWIDSPTRVFAYGRDLQPKPVVVPARSETLSAAGALGLRSIGGHSLGDAAHLVEELVGWADSHWGLTATHRPTYQAWHCRGRQVLRLSRSHGGGVKVAAGVNYTTPPEGEEKALAVTVTTAQPLTAALRAQIETRVLRAIWKRLAESDAGDVEHQLQEALSPGPLRRDLGLAASSREFPAWRAPGRPGFLDFLGLDRHNRLHIVETKVNPDDVRVVLQALDYAIWVMANGADIREQLGWVTASGPERVAIDLICAPRVKPGPDGGRTPDGTAIGRYLTGQLEALSPDVEWRIWLVPDPLAEPPTLMSAPPRTMPSGDLVAAPVTGPRWKGHVQAILNQGGAPPMYPSPEAAVLPAALPVFSELQTRHATHRWVLSPRSSQALALNLFAPLGSAGVTGVFAELGADITSAEPPEFEYRDPSDRLAEARPHSPYQTQVDVVLRGKRADGARLVALIEVKFTEEFSPCTAYENPGNVWRDVCRSSGVFGGQPDKCFQLANHGHGRRRYDEALSGVAARSPERAAGDGGCLVRRALNQPMRSLALAHLLLNEQEADHVIYALCAPHGHTSAWRRFGELRQAFPDTDNRTIKRVDPASVASHQPDGGAAVAAIYNAHGQIWPLIS